MKKFTAIYSQSGLTLIEVLVVIAIIGLLMGLIPFSFSDAIERGRVTHMATKSRSAVLCIIRENIDREARSEPLIWPEYVGLDGQGGGTTANDYFSYLAHTLPDIRTTMFSGAGIATATDATDLKSRGNAWCIFWSGEQGRTNDTVRPFMVTRNFKGTSLPTGTLSLDNYCDPNIRPFGNKRIVITHRDASVDTFSVHGEETLHFIEIFFGNSSTNIAIARTADE